MRSKLIFGTFPFAYLRKVWFWSLSGVCLVTHLWTVSSHLSGSFARSTDSQLIPFCDKRMNANAYINTRFYTEWKNERKSRCHHKSKEIMTLIMRWVYGHTLTQHLDIKYARIYTWLSRCHQLHQLFEEDAMIRVSVKHAQGSTNTRDPSGNNNVRISRAVKLFISALHFMIFFKRNLFSVFCFNILKIFLFRYILGEVNISSHHNV